MKENPVVTREKMNDFKTFFCWEKKIFILMGLPYSGKSTLRRKIMENIPGLVVISADQIRAQVYGQRYYQDGEALVWAIREKMLKLAMINANFIIVDETNTTAGRRGSIIKLAKEHSYHTTGIFLDRNVKECLMQAESEHDGEIIPTINRMAGQFEKPSKAEGFNEIWHITDQFYKSKEFPTKEFIENFKQERCVYEKTNKKIIERVVGEV